jgi:outer membrane receptor protein involved in Fe transport
VVSANRGFGYADEDATLLKNTAFGENGKYRLSFRVEFYNLFNRHYYSNPNTDITSAQFGFTTGLTGNGRNGQFGARFQW